MKKMLTSIVCCLAATITFAQETETSSSTVELEEVVVLQSKVIDVAQERVTPVAVTSIKASEIALKVGNLEFPEIMNTTPGVYATKQGGGYGDSRISLRGFDQRSAGE